MEVVEQVTIGLGGSGLRRHACVAPCATPWVKGHMALNSINLVNSAAVGHPGLPQWTLVIQLTCLILD